MKCEMCEKHKPDVKYRLYDAGGPLDSLDEGWWERHLCDACDISRRSLETMFTHMAIGLGIFMGSIWIYDSFIKG